MGVVGMLMAWTTRFETRRDTGLSVVGCAAVYTRCVTCTPRADCGVSCDTASPTVYGGGDSSQNATLPALVFCNVVYPQTRARGGNSRIGVHARPSSPAAAAPRRRGAACAVRRRLWRVWGGRAVRGNITTYICDSNVTQLHPWLHRSRFRVTGNLPVTGKTQGSAHSGGAAGTPTQVGHTGHTDTRITRTNLTRIPDNHPDPQTHTRTIARRRPGVPSTVPVPKARE